MLDPDRRPSLEERVVPGRQADDEDSASHEESVAVRDGDRQTRSPDAHEDVSAAINPSASWTTTARSVHDGNAAVPCEASVFQSEIASSTANALQQSHESRRRPRDRLAATSASVQANTAAAASVALCSEFSRRSPPMFSSAEQTSAPPSAAAIADTTMNSRRENTQCLALVTRFEGQANDRHASEVSVDGPSRTREGAALSDLVQHRHKRHAPARLELHAWRNGLSSTSTMEMPRRTSTWTR